MATTEKYDQILLNSTTDTCTVITPDNIKKILISNRIPHVSINNHLLFIALYKDEFGLAEITSPISMWFKDLNDLPLMVEYISNMYEILEADKSFDDSMRFVGLSPKFEEDNSLSLYLTPAEIPVINF